MKSLVVEVPEQVAAEVQRLVAGGWFHSENEVARQALIEFVRSRSAEFQEQLQRDDIAWAVHEGAVDLPSRGIDADRARNLRDRLRTFAADWERPEMKAYDKL